MPSQECPDIGWYWRGQGYCPEHPPPDGWEVECDDPECCPQPVQWGGAPSAACVVCHTAEREEAALDLLDERWGSPPPPGTSSIADAVMAYRRGAGTRGPGYRGA